MQIHNDKLQDDADAVADRIISVCRHGLCIYILLALAGILCSLILV